MRPYVLVSSAMSLDGHIDDTSPERLLLSDDADFDRVDEVRASCDAILVGAATIRADNPRLMIRSESRRAARMARGLPPDPIKATITSSGDLDPTSRFFTAGDAPKIVYCPSSRVGSIAVGDSATVVGAGDPLEVRRLLADLRRRGVERLMVEGGGGVNTQFLTAGVVDEIQLVVAPFFVGEGDAPRWVNAGTFPHNSRKRMRLAEVRTLGDLVLLRYVLAE